MLLLCPTYSGNYGDAITIETLKDFHRRRVQVLVESGPDLIAFETVPNKLEAQVLTRCLWSWMINDILVFFSFRSLKFMDMLSLNIFIHKMIEICLDLVIKVSFLF